MRTDISKHKNSEVCSTATTASNYTYASKSYKFCNYFTMYIFSIVPCLALFVKITISTARYIILLNAQHYEACGWYLFTLYYYFPSRNRRRTFYGHEMCNVWWLYLLQ